jgi:hypothetical protein
LLKKKAISAFFGATLPFPYGREGPQKKPLKGCHASAFFAEGPFFLKKPFCKKGKHTPFFFVFLKRLLICGGISPVGAFFSFFI